MSNQLLFKLTLDKPPSWNAVYKTSLQGHIYMSKKGKEWKETAVAHAKTALRCAKFDTYPGKVYIEYQLYLANVERSDIDNRLKLTNDVLEAAGVITNDNRIFSAFITKHQCPRDEQRIELSIYEYTV